MHVVRLIGDAVVVQLDRELDADLVRRRGQLAQLRAVCWKSRVRVVLAPRQLALPLGALGVAPDGRERDRERQVQQAARPRACATSSER